MPYRKSKSRKSVAAPKFYFFDTGVWNALLGRFELAPKTREYGDAMEHRIFHELSSYLDYTRSDEGLTFWRPQKQNTEVDFFVGDRIAIEVKATARVDRADTKGIELLSKQVKLKKKIIVCSESEYRLLDDGVEVMPYVYFCEQLWSGKIV